MAGNVLELLASLVVLTVAGDQFIISVARLASALHVRPTVVGAVVGGFGTSIPELIVAAVATARGSPQIAVGSAVGSIIANVSLALAVSALISPIRVDSITVRREAPLSVVSVLLFALFTRGGISRQEGVVMGMALVPVLALLLASARLGTKADALGPEVVEFFETRRRPRPEVARAVASIAFMLGGAELMVGSASALATRLGLDQGFVGLTIVAVGTSAPLIASSIQAARRGEHDLVVGNVLGGNLFIALIGGALVGLLPGGSAGRVGGVSLWLMGGVVAAAWAAMAKRSIVTRWEAGLLLSVYIAMLPFVSR